MNVPRDFSSKNSEERTSDLAYLAGLIDGEGCISTHKVSATSTSIGLDLRVVNTYLPVLQWCQTRFGGRIHKKQLGAAHYKQGYAWCLSVGPLGKLLPQLLPFLQIKQKQARLAIRFSQLGYGCQTERHAIRGMIARLNK